jgi:hypothetical protein
MRLELRVESLSISIRDCLIFKGGIPIQCETLINKGGILFNQGVIVSTKLKLSEQT